VNRKVIWENGSLIENSPATGIVVYPVVFWQAGKGGAVDMGTIEGIMDQDVPSAARTGEATATATRDKRAIIENCMFAVLI
jgi:hypothetical protein